MPTTESPSSQQAALNYINYAAHNEYRTLIGIIAGMNDGLTSGELIRNSVRIQGERPVWKPDTDRIPVYEILAGSGIATKSETGESGRWHADEEKRDLYLALGGLFGQWSLKYHDISTQLVIRKPNTVEVGVPMQRFAIYRELLGYSPLPQDPSRSNETTATEISKLVADNLLQLAPQEEEGEPIFVTLAMRRGSVDGYVGVEQRAIIETVKSLGPDQTITLQELVELARSAYPQVNAEVLRRIILRPHSSTSLKSRLFLSLKSADIVRRPSLDNISFNPAFAAPIEEMVEGVEEIIGGYGIARRVEAAREIVSSPEKVRTLAGKAREFSIHVTKHSGSQK